MTSTHVSHGASLGPRHERLGADRCALAEEEAVSLPPPSSREPSLPVGTLLAGRYRVERVIASGGMGVVYACLDTMLDRPVAIKLVRDRLVENKQLMGRFFREARISAQLRSRHVAQVFDCGTLPSGGPYMVMELLEGCDLNQVLRKCGPLPPAVVVNYARQVCEGLREAHRKGIVHRDLKPENLFLTFGPDGSEVIKIVDFGISKECDLREHGRVITDPSESVGSPHYMSPEQLTCPEYVDPRSDIWALGVVMYELLTGSAPFDGIGVAQVCVSVLSDPIQPISEQRTDVHPELEAVIMRCLARERDFRYSSVENLAQALSVFLQRSDAASMSLRRTDLDLGLPIPQVVRTSVVTTAPIELLPLRRRRNQQRFAAAFAMLSSAAVFAVSFVGAEQTVASAADLAGTLTARVTVALRSTPPPLVQPQPLDDTSGEHSVVSEGQLVQPIVTPLDVAQAPVEPKASLGAPAGAAVRQIAARSEVARHQASMAEAHLAAEQAAEAEQTQTNTFSAAIRPASLPTTPGPNVRRAEAAKSGARSIDLMDPY